MDADPKLDQWIRDSGAQLEAAFREAGSPLPPELTGEFLVRNTLEENERWFNSPEGQARSKRMLEIANEVAAELPGGHEHPDYSSRLLARLQQLFSEGRDGAGASV
jgi:hypothetical protein